MQRQSIILALALLAIASLTLAFATGVAAQRPGQASAKLENVGPENIDTFYHAIDAKIK